MKHTLQVFHRRAQEFIQNSKLRNKKFYDRNMNKLDIKINDLVLVKKEPYNKFGPVYAGPYKVKQVKGTNIVIEIENKLSEIHKNRVVKA